MTTGSFLDSIEVHNAEPEFHAGPGGWKFPRFDRRTRTGIHGRNMAAQPTGVELRFVGDGPAASFTLQNHGERASVVLRKGAFFVARYEIASGSTRRFPISGGERLPQVTAEKQQSGGWSHEVWRIQLERGDLLLKELDGGEGDLRPPRAEEKPRLRWLAYGSSITHADLNGYPSVAAQVLPADVLNKGMSGSCHIENRTADYLAAQRFDLATLELGINMRSAFDPTEFERRVVYLLNKLREGRPETPLVLLTHFLNKDHHPVGEPPAEAGKQIAFDEVLRRQHRDRDDPHLHLIEGTELLTDFGLLAADLIHPTHEGQAQMGLRLAERLRGRIG